MVEFLVLLNSIIECSIINLSFNSFIISSIHIPFAFFSTIYFVLFIVYIYSYMFFTDELIDGETFFDLTENDLTNMGIKIGPKKKIIKLITERKKVSEEEYLVDENGKLIALNQFAADQQQYVPEQIAERRRTSTTSSKSISSHENSTSIVSIYSFVKICHHFLT